MFLLVLIPNLERIMQIAINKRKMTVKECTNSKCTNVFYVQKHLFHQKNQCEECVKKRKNDD